MGARPVTWTFTRSPLCRRADGRHATSSPTIAGSSSAGRDGRRRPRAGTAQAATRRSWRRPASWPLQLETEADAGVPYSYTLEGDVEDVSRQHIANRASITVHPAPWYVGIRRPPYFVEQKTGLKTEIVAVAPDGKPCAGVPVDGHADADPVDERAPRRRQRLLHLGHRAQGSPAGTWTVTTAADPVPLDIPLPNGGYFVLEARADGGRRSLCGDARRRSTRSATATPRGRASTTTASSSCPSARPTSPARPRGS